MTVKNNPFASRFIRPGAIEYLFDQGQSVEGLMDQFCNSLGRRAAIVGPHGSGKSTLLHTLVPRLGSVEWTWDSAAASASNPPLHLSMDGREIQSQWRNGMFPCIRWFRMSSLTRSASPLFEDRSQWNVNTLIVIDGYEQLGPIERLRLWRSINHSRAGLLVTCHYPLFLYPTLMTTCVTEDSAALVVRKLLAHKRDLAEKLIRSDRWAAIRDRWQNNLRESLFELYDLMETSHG